jgi:hypothetical protein
MNFFIFLFLVASQSVFASDCILKNEVDGQKQYWCQADGTQKGFHFLDLKGSIQNTAYYHGLFLAKEMDSGVLHGVVTSLESAYSELTPEQRKQFKNLEACALDGYRFSATQEFKDLVKQTYRGYKLGGGKYDQDLVEKANYLTEFSIFADALQRILISDPKKAKRKIMLSCAPYFVGDEVFDFLKKIGQFIGKSKMGCSGFSMPGNDTQVGSLIHGRNLDTGLLGFFEQQQVITRLQLPNGVTTFTMATAGMHYGGGVSGFNSHGISISVHELQTTSPQIRYTKNTSDVAPFLAQKVLNKARNLNEAIRIIKSSHAFGAWTFLISDSKNNETISVEMNGLTTVVARRVKDLSMAQTNHFLSPETQKTGYEYSMNKSLETRARFAFIENQLAASQKVFNAQTGIEILSGHWDQFVGRRSFGRTTTKVYTAASHVMIPSRYEWWMSTGEEYPTNRSPFVGFRWNSASEKLEIIGVTRTHETLAPQAWYDSMRDYVHAFLSYEQKDLDQSIDYLILAIAKTESIGIDEYPYHFMKARALLLKAVQTQDSKVLEEAKAAWEKLANIIDDQKVKTHLYENLQVQFWRFRLNQYQSQLSKETYKNIEEKNSMLDKIGILKSQFPGQVELEKLEKTIDIQDAKAWLLAEHLHFVTVE